VARLAPRSPIASATRRWTPLTNSTMHVRYSRRIGPLSGSSTRSSRRGAAGVNCPVVASTRASSHSTPIEAGSVGVNASFMCREYGLRQVCKSAAGLPTPEGVAGSADRLAAMPERSRPQAKTP